MAKTAFPSAETKSSTQDQLRFFRDCTFSTGELVHLRRFCRPNGTMLILPYDQFIEHDSRHLQAESDSGNPDYLVELAIDGKYTGLVFHYGLSRRFWSRCEGQVPIMVKVNGKTSIPAQNQPL